MALGEYAIFTWKSKKKQKKEAAEYEMWAFPYGSEQREKLQKLLLKVFPKETVATTLIPFLTARELFEGFCKSPDLEDYAIDRMLNGLKKYKRIIKKNEMSTYVALVLANARIDADLNYPTADDIRAKAMQLERLIITDE
ncbi:MAG: hypothetical protein LBD92_02810 [Oscillospiraceae bacterium]|jgi:hypothetical protein|nr:hypothetical protein [Oscillospiraceae bacterium]